MRDTALKIDDDEFEKVISESVERLEAVDPTVVDKIGVIEEALVPLYVFCAEYFLESRKISRPTLLSLDEMNGYNRNAVSLLQSALTLVDAFKYGKYVKSDRKNGSEELDSLLKTIILEVFRFADIDFPTIGTEGINPKDIRIKIEIENLNVVYLV
ncbi:hypothetical protein DESA109040_16075 [Deinococcus saxicola]|uniref:hypothetical protein n=1 Tax=Deinococcus saxicola TaxID=249406 RepID=UPI0039EE6AA5